MNTTPTTPTQQAPPPPPKLQTPRAPRSSKRKQPPAKNIDASLQELIAEAARLHSEVYVDDVSGTIHGPRKASRNAELAAPATRRRTPARASWGFREAYADALAKSSPERTKPQLRGVKPSAVAEPVALKPEHEPLVPDAAGEETAGSFARAVAAVRLFVWSRLSAVGMRWSKVGHWYQHRRLRQLKMKRLRVVETVSLGEKRFISVVQVDGAEFLVGGSATGIALLRGLGSGQETSPAALQQHAEQG